MTTKTDCSTFTQPESCSDHEIQREFENFCKTFEWAFPPNEILDKWFSYFDSEKLAMSDDFEAYQATDEDRPYRDQLKLLRQINKIPWLNFTQKVNNWFKLGHTMEDIYYNFCREMNYKLIRRKRVKKFFKHCFLGPDIDTHKPLAEMIYKTYLAELFEMVMAELGSGQTRESVFQLSCQRLGYDLVEEERVKKWFDEFCLPNSSIYFGDKINPTHWRLMEQITVRYWTLRKGIYCWKSNGDYAPGAILPNQSRYGLGFKYCEEKLLFFDFFQGIERDITFENYSIVWEEDNYSKLEIYPISQNRLLLYKHDIECGYPSIIYLVEIDYKNWTCKILDQHNSGHLNQTFVLDHKDTSKFVIFYTKRDDDDWSYIRSGQILGDKIYSQENVARIEQHLLSPKLEGNTLTGFYVDHPREVKWFSIWQYNLDKKQMYKSQRKIEFLFDCDIEETWSVMAYPRCPKYTWSDSTCYTVACNPNSKWLVYAFNVETFQCTSINIMAGRIYGLFVDQNEVLTFCGGKIVFRLPLRQPESLKTIIWLNIRRQALFFKNDLYSKAIKALPQNCLLPPFYQHDLIENS